MLKILRFNSITHFINKGSVSFLGGNAKVIAQFILTALFIGLGIWFMKQEQTELHDVKRVLISSYLPWVVVGICLVLFYIFLQGLMYCASFASVKSKLGIADAVVLFLKRNFISVFLPAGGISSLAFFTANIEKKGITKSQIYFASSVYGFVGIVSVVAVAVPAFIYALFEGSVGSSEWYALIAVVLLSVFMFYIYRSIITQGIIYRWLIKFFPAAEVFMDDLRNNKIDKRYFFLTVAISIIIEFVGIAHLYVAMKALQFSPSLLAAVMGYIIAVVFLIISPFLRGLGAIEFSMVYVLVRFGYTNIEAIALTFLFRFFEFWLPLFAGIGSFILQVNKLLMRIVPAILLFVLGVINIISVLTPAISERVEYLKNILFIDVINASNYFVLVAGLFLLVTAAFMLKGLRSAWWLALILSIVSFVGHITKAIDYEEASLALAVMLILFVTRKEYYIRNSRRLRYFGLQTSLLSIVAVLIYGIVGFYFLDKKHFNIDFNWIQSIRYTIQNYLLIGSRDLIPSGKFARDFIYSINASGFLTMSFFIYTLIRPYVIKNDTDPAEYARAMDLLNKYGKSGMDYFKTYSDKLIYAPSELNAFIAYRVTSNFAIVLENPVAEDDNQFKLCIKQFDKYCYDSGLKSIYYRVPEENQSIYNELGKKSLFLGQEGILDINNFTLEGGTKKPMRNAINKINEKGYKVRIHVPPVMDGVLQKIKSVSDEWLKQTGRSEILFSQGMFVWNELKNQTIITVENSEEKIIAFLNVIPDYAKDEGTYDLMRKTADAPNGIMDFILIELIKYLKSQGYRYVNLGFAPLSGLTDPQSFPEKSMKFAYEKIRSFSHYKGMREYKEKFFPSWYNKYLIYDHDYDLIQIPGALSKVIKP
jgi:phosphatidylglycerol lysyltransferase